MVTADGQSDGLFDVVETSIARLRAALDAGEVTSVELVAAYLERIARFDRSGEVLNSVPMLNRHVFDEARAADERRSGGVRLSPLDGIPYTAKDSYAVRGYSLAAGSPAFRELVARDDAFTISQLRAGGAIYLGRTTMPPMANGGMQRGLYGRAESPYNRDFLTAAFASGSSNGSGTATAASFAAFGLGEETWSSGRAPASNNGLVAYTPSRGVISVRGNWPLVPTMDVVVPHTRTVEDLLEVLDVLVADDAETEGDFWRAQQWVDLPTPSTVRPESYVAIPDGDGLAGIRIGIPRMYINRDSGAREPIATRPSVVELWEQARADLEALGAEVVEVDFPVVSNYERDRDGAASMVDRGLVPEGFAHDELWDLSMLWWDGFLQQYSAAGPRRLAEVEGRLIFPRPGGALADRYGGADFDIADYVRLAKQGLRQLDEIPTIEAGVRGLEQARYIDFEEWLVAEGLDAVVFPAVADVAPADADVTPASADLAWRNGTWVANGNLVPRHLGIPTVTVPMGLMTDIRMPVGLTFAGAAYADTALIRYAAAFEAVRSRRTVPPLTPRSPATARRRAPSDPERRSPDAPRLRLEACAVEGVVDVTLIVDSPVPLARVRVTVDGAPLTLVSEGARTFRGRTEVHVVRRPHSEWFEPYGSVIVALAEDASGAASGNFTTVDGIAGIDGTALPTEQGVSA
jgi:amidase